MKTIHHLVINLVTLQMAGRVAAHQARQVPVVLGVPVDQVMDATRIKTKTQVRVTGIQDQGMVTSLDCLVAHLTVRRAATVLRFLQRHKRPSL